MFGIQSPYLLLHVHSEYFHIKILSDHLTIPAREHSCYSKWTKQQHIAIHPFHTLASSGGTPRGQWSKTGKLEAEKGTKK